MAITIEAYRELHALERCDFDDECDSCDSPSGGSWVKLYHAPEDVTEADYYMCGCCIEKAAAIDHMVNYEF